MSTHNKHRSTTRRQLAASFTHEDHLKSRYREAEAGKPPALAVACALAVSMLASTAVSAADDARSEAEIQAEIDTLQKLLAEKRSAAAQAPVAEAPAPAEAKQLDAVVVSVKARNELQKLKDVPRSISVVEGEELTKLETNSFRDILTRIGNVSQTYTNPQSSSLVIRGLGWTTGAGVMDPSVGVVVDGVSYGVTGLAAAPNYSNVGSVSVTRGPQGTLGGKNVSVGQIAINTRPPSFTAGAEGSITYGEFNTLSTRGVIGGAVIDDLVAWRGSFLREQADGPFVNANDQNYTYKATDRTSGQVQFLVTPSENLSARIILDYTPMGKEASNEHVFFNRQTPALYDSVNEKGDPYPVDLSNENVGKLSRSWFSRELNYTTDDYLSDEINRLNQNPSNYSTKGATANLQWISASGYTLTSISAFKDFFFDSGAGPISVFDIDRSPSAGHVEYEQYTQELRINSPISGFVDYQAGLYYFRNTIPERWNTLRHGSDAGAYYATTPQYTRLDKDSAGRSLMQDSIDRLFTKTKDEIDNRSAAAYANFNWHFTQALTLNTGLRLTHENRNTASERLVVDQGFGAALNPASINNVQLGGFSTLATGALDKKTGNTDAQLALANSVAQRYFGVAQYESLNTDQLQQVADAKAIRRARLGGLYQRTDASSYKKVLPTFNISPKYKINPDQTTYVSWQHGEKAGISQIVGATATGGKDTPVKKEVSNTYEIGLNSVLLDGQLTINADLYLQDVDNYIQPMFFEDKAQTIANNDQKIAYTSGLGNVPKVQSKGLEVDVSYSGIRDTTLRFAGAYTDAKYKDFSFLAKPLELGGTTTPYYDATGKTLPGSAKLTFNIAADYHRPVLETQIFHTNINYRYTSRYNNDPSLSRFAVVDAYGLIDFSAGIGHRSGAFDVNFIAKNLLNQDYGFNSNWITYFPSNPRWVGVALSSKFY